MRCKKGKSKNKSKATRKVMNYDEMKAKLIEDEDFQSSCNFLPHVTANPLHIYYELRKQPAPSWLDS